MQKHRCNEIEKNDAGIVGFANNNGDKPGERPFFYTVKCNVCK
jgi:hypothetical protein